MDAGKLEKQVEFMQKNPQYGACFSAVYLMDEDGNDTTDNNSDMRDLFSKSFESQKEWMEFFLFYGNSLCHPSALVRKEVIELVGGFNLMFCQLADYDLWIRIVAETPIYVFKERLIHFRWSSKKKNQVSSITEATRARTHNEHIMIRRNMVERLSDDKFKQFFSDKFRNPKSSSHLEIEFEKAFLLANCMEEAPDWKILGMEKLEKVLRIPGAVEILQEHFGMSIFDVYEWHKTRMYRDPWILNECEEQKKVIERQRKQIMDFENSTSWKITAPFRRVTDIFRK